MGYAEHVRERPGSGVAAWRKVRPRDSCVGLAEAQAQTGARTRSRAANGAGTAPGPKPRQRLWFCRRGDFDKRPFVFDLALVQGGAWRERAVEGAESDRNTGGTGRPGITAPDF